MLHGDVNCSNVLVRRWTAKLGDFGLSRAVARPGGDPHGAGLVAGNRTTTYLSPELLLGGEEYEAEFLRKGEAAGWQHTCSIHNIGWGHVLDDGPHNKALAMKIMEFIRKVHKQGFYYDEETGLTFAVRVGVSNDLKAMGLWFGRGGSSASKYQHCNWNEVHM